MRVVGVENRDRAARRPGNRDAPGRAPTRGVGVLVLLFLVHSLVRRLLLLLAGPSTMRALAVENAVLRHQRFKLGSR